jgi:hypothetical protein
MFSFSRIREAVESGDNDEEFDNVDDNPNQEEDESCGCESRIGFDDGDINGAVFRKRKRLFDAPKLRETSKKSMRKKRELERQGGKK